MVQPLNVRNETFNHDKQHISLSSFIIDKDDRFCNSAFNLAQKE